MQINGVARHLLAPLSSGLTPNDSDKTAGNSAAIEIAGEDVGVAGSGSSFHNILSQYDVSSITPRQFSDLVQQLHTAGEIDDNEVRELNKIRLELERSGADADESLDLVDFLEDRLKAGRDALEQTRQNAGTNAAAILDGQRVVAESSRQLEWVRKFKLVQAAGADGIDAGA